MTLAAARLFDPGDLSASRFLAAVNDPARPAIASERLAVVVAHPDDETVGCGALLARLRGARLVLVTDGSPEDPADARANGFASGKAYGQARAAELARVMRLAGMPNSALRSLAIRDQQASFHLVELARELAELFRQDRTVLVLTHAYEGGHPDHDATAFAVHAAARILAKRGQLLEVIEMPLYHAGPEGWRVQRFPPEPRTPATEVVLNASEHALKREMMAAHASQASVLGNFAVDVERFRPAPRHDFGETPNGGDLLYERYGWGMTGERWSALATAALADLGLGAQP